MEPNAVAVVALVVLLLILLLAKFFRDAAKVDDIDTPTARSTIASPH
jgi:hypothetical protein